MKSKRPFHHPVHSCQHSKIKNKNITCDIPNAEKVGIVALFAHMSQEMCNESETDMLQSVDAKSIDSKFLDAP